MMKLKQLLSSRNQLPEKLLFRKDITLCAGISTSTETTQNFTSDGKNPGVNAPYTVFKGKAACSVHPSLPNFSKLTSGTLVVKRRGCIIMKFWPAIGERKYDWDKRQVFALSVTEVGSLINMGPKDSCEFFHDPSMLSSNAGQVRKSLSIKPNESGGGYFINLNVVNNIHKTNDRFVVPVTAAEFSVMRTAFSFALPHIMGWDKYAANRLPGSIERNSSRLIPLLEWEK